MRQRSDNGEQNFEIAYRIRVVRRLAESEENIVEPELPCIVEPNLGGP